MEFKTPVKLFYDNKYRVTMFVHWKLIMVLDDRGISRLRPEVLQVIDIPISNFKIKITIKDHKYVNNETAFSLTSPAYFNSKKQTLHLIFDTLP